MPDRTRVLGFRQGGASDADERGNGSRLLRQGIREQRIGRAGFTAIEVRVTQPHERVHIVRLQCARALEARDRFGTIASNLVQMTEIVWPAWHIRRERLRIEQTRFGGIAVLGGHQQLAHLAVGGRELRDRCRRILRLCRERRVLLAQLTLHLLAGARESRKRYGVQRFTLGPLGRLRTAARHDRQREREYQRATTEDAEVRVLRGASGILRTDYKGARDHRLVPSRIVVYRSIATSCHVSSRPSGHRTRTAGRAGTSPRPTSTLGSFAEA